MSPADGDTEAEVDLRNIESVAVSECCASSRHLLFSTPRPPFLLRLAGAAAGRCNSNVQLTSVANSAALRSVSQEKGERGREVNKEEGEKEERYG